MVVVVVVGVCWHCSYAQWFVQNGCWGAHHGVVWKCHCVSVFMQVTTLCFAARKKKFPHSVSRRDTERREINWIYSSVWLSQDISCIVCVRPSSLHDSTILHFVNLAGMCVRSGLFVSAAHAFTVQ